MTVETQTVTTPTTQGSYPWRATARTILAVLAAAAAVTPAVLDAISDGDTSRLGGWAAVALGIAGAVTRVLALPGVESFLQRFIPLVAAAPATEIRFVEPEPPVKVSDDTDPGEDELADRPGA